MLSEVEKIVREAGDLIRYFYRGAFEVREKSPDNPVTEADLAADRFLRQALGDLQPAAGWLSEETADHLDRLKHDQIWVVDPLDGTKEFVMGVPEFSISTALVAAGQPVLAVVFNPITGEMFTAAAGRGVCLNGEPAAVSRRTALLGAVVDASRSERRRGEFAPFEPLVTLQTLGSIAYKLARVGAGQSDATWSRGPKNEWDICAGVLLVEEGGGRCVDLDGRPFLFNQPGPKVNGIIADNGLLHEQVLAALAPYRDSARRD